MIICANCSRENADHYKFCLGCGTEIAGAAPGGSGSKAGSGVPKLGSVPKLGGGGKLKLKGGLFGKSERPGGLGLGLSRRLSASKPEPEDEDEPELEAEPEVDEAPASDPPATATPVAETQAEDFVIPVEDDEGDDDAFDGEIEPAEPESDPVDGPQSEPPADQPELLEDDVIEDDDFADDFEEFDDEPAPVVARPVVAQPVKAAPLPPARPAPAGLDEIDDIDDSMLDEGPPAGRICQACNAIVPDGFKFCGVCGSRYDAPQAAPEAARVKAPAVQTGGAPSAHLVLIHPDGTEGEIFPLNASETTVGRSHPSPIFAEDPFLSPRHATFYFVQGQLYVRDESSLNGVFLRIRAEVELFHWDMFRIGQQLLRFEEMSQVRPVMPGSGDGTTVMGSPVRGTWGRLASVVALDTTTSVWALRKPEVYLGRERGEICFPEDGFVSGSHCKVSMRRGRYFLGDLDSTNGTYLRIKGEGIVTRGDLLLLGQQLFKVQLNR